MKKLSIGMRLTLWYLAIFAVAQFVFAAGMWLALRHSLYDLVDRDLDGQVEDLKALLQAQKKDISVAQLTTEVGEEYSLERSGDYLQIYLGHGEWIFRSRFMRSHPLAPPEPNQVNRASYMNLRLGGEEFRFITTRLEVNGLECTVQLGGPAAQVRQTLFLFRLSLLMFAPLLLLGAAAGGYWLSRRALAPVDVLVRTAHTISGANLGSRLENLNTGDELQRLADTLNEMLDRIETAFSRVTQFTADASHELRTPIALIRTEAELALRKSRGEGEYKESLRHVLLEAERTASLLEELLALARADSGRESLNMHPVDLSQTLRDAVDGWRRVATIRRLEFSANVDVQQPFVLGDRTALRRVVDILLDNAFKYTQPPGGVSLSLEQDGEKAVITVQDTGVGIAEEEQGKIFKRFYRVDKARSRELGGAGLGLAIAEWIVQQHGGTISVKSQPGRGSTFRAELPRTTVPAPSPQPV